MIALLISLSDHADMLTNHKHKIVKLSRSASIVYLRSSLACHTVCVVPRCLVYAICRCEHTLPITSLAVGLGEVNAVVATVSLDRTMQLHAMSDGRLLLNARLPCALHCVALDPGEHAVYAGGSDGCIYEVSLTGANGASGSSSTHPQGASAGSGASLSELSGGSHVQRMEGHSRVVNSLAVSLDGELLVSGGCKRMQFYTRQGVCDWSVGYK